MNRTMTHKGYAARVEFDARDKRFVGLLARIRDVVGFHGDGVAALHLAFGQAVDDCLETCRQAGRDPPHRASGGLMLCIPPETHAAAPRATELAGKSLDQWADEVLRDAASG